MWNGWIQCYMPFLKGAYNIVHSVKGRERMPCRGVAKMFKHYSKNQLPQQRQSLSFPIKRTEPCSLFLGNDAHPQTIDFKELWATIFQPLSKICPTSGFQGPWGGPQSPLSEAVMNLEVGQQRGGMKPETMCSVKNGILNMRNEIQWQPNITNHAWRCSSYDRPVPCILSQSGFIIIALSNIFTDVYITVLNIEFTLNIKCSKPWRPEASKISGQKKCILQAQNPIVDEIFCSLIWVIAVWNAGNILLEDGRLSLVVLNQQRREHSNRSYSWKGMAGVECFHCVHNRHSVMW